MERIQICVEDEVVKEIEQKAIEQDRTFSSMARMLLKQALGDQNAKPSQSTTG
jgi:hypothetical protein